MLALCQGWRRRGCRSVRAAGRSRERCLGVGASPRARDPRTLLPERDVSSWRSVRGCGRARIEHRIPTSATDGHRLQPPVDREAPLGRRPRKAKGPLFHGLRWHRRRNSGENDAGSFSERAGYAHVEPGSLRDWRDLSRGSWLLPATRRLGGGPQRSSAGPRHRRARCLSTSVRNLRRATGGSGVAGVVPRCVPRSRARSSTRSRTARCVCLLSDPRASQYRAGGFTMT